MSVEKEQILMRIIEVEESISRLTETVRGLLEEEEEEEEDLLPKSSSVRRFEAMIGSAV